MALQGSRHEKTLSWDEALTSQLRHHAPSTLPRHMTGLLAHGMFEKYRILLILSAELS